MRGCRLAAGGLIQTLLRFRGKARLRDILDSEGKTGERTLEVSEQY
jgi:hypothetical protein